MQAADKSANKVSDKNLSPPYHFDIICIQPNTEGLITMENALIICKITDYIHPSALASVWQLIALRLGAAPGHTETCVE